MPFISFDLEKRRTIYPRPNLPAADSTLKLENVSRGSWPGRGLLYSFLIHEAVLFALLIVPVVYHSAEDAHPKEVEQVVDLTKTVLYLPTLRDAGGSRPRQASGPRAKEPAPGPKAAPAKDSAAPATKGFSYTGPQPIVSDFPKPTNSFLTVLQPELENPPVLKPPLSLPNMIQMADASPLPLPPSPRVELKPKPPVEEKPEPKPEPPPVAKPVRPLPPPDAPSIKLAVPATVQAPKLVVANNDPAVPPPPPVPVKLQPKPPADPAPAPVQKAAVKQSARSASEIPAAPKFDRVSSLPSRGSDMQNLLTLSPMPAPPDPALKVPPGEARGRFAISPDAEPAPPDSEPGLRTGTASGNASLAAGGLAGNSGALGNATGGGIGTGAGGAATGSGGAGSGAGGGTAKGAGSGGGTSDTGLGNGTGSGNQPGSASGTGQGSGNGQGSGTGSGSGSGTGAGTKPNPFPGITIQGGRMEGSGAAKGVVNLGPAPAQPKYSYGLTVVSTPSSGGGLPDYGVFSHETVYTVYIDMRKTTGDPSPSWTLQYAIMEGAATQAARNSGRSQEGMVPPFPTMKPLPEISPDVARRYLGRLVAIYAVINPEGKLEQIAVKQSPDPQLNEPVLAALAKWVFRPASLNGSPVPAKIMLGIPLSLAQ